MNHKREREEDEEVDVSSVKIMGFDSRVKVLDSGIQGEKNCHDNVEVMMAIDSMFT